MSNAPQSSGFAPATNRPKITKEDLQHHQQELGVLGKFFGSRINAPFYIAALAIVLSFAVIGIIAYRAPSDTQSMMIFIPIISGALGYLFGKSTS